MSFAQGYEASDSKPNKHTFAVCSKCGREFYKCSVQKCPHNTVNKKFGPSICMYCCRKCDHNIFEQVGQSCQLRKNIKLRETEDASRNLENFKKKDTLNGN